MKRVIVTGANGFIGSSLVKLLISRGVEVVAIDISFANDHIPKSPFVTKIESTINVRLTDLIPPSHYDACYHLAWAGVNGPSKADPVAQLENIHLSVICADVCKQIGCTKLLCAGTVAEQSVNSLPHLTTTNGGMMYGVAKHCAHLILEDYCKNIGLQFVWMQFSNIYGIGNKTGNLISYTLSEILSGKEATFGPAAQPYDFIYVDDLLEAIYRLGENSTHYSSYYIGSGKPRILKDYLYCVGDLAGKRELISVGIRPDDGILYNFDMFDITPLLNDIGEYVSLTFEEGISKTINWLKKE